MRHVPSRHLSVLSHAGVKVRKAKSVKTLNPVSKKDDKMSALKFV